MKGIQNLSGSASFERFKLYRTGMTVGDFLGPCGKREDISWDRNHEYIELDLPPEPAVVG